MLTILLEYFTEPSVNPHSQWNPKKFSQLEVWAMAEEEMQQGETLWHLHSCSFSSQML